MNQIIGVAIKYGDLMICLPKPNRHHDCIRYAVEILGLDKPISTKCQGFYTSDGIYLDRKQAIVFINKFPHQLRDADAINHTKLYSEALW